MSDYFPKQYEPFGENISVKLNLSNYVTKVDLKRAKRIYTSNLAVKFDLASLKAEVDKRDVEKLKTVLVDLSKLNNAVNNEIVQKIVHDKLIAKVNVIHTSGFVLKAQYNTDISCLDKKINDADKKIPEISGLVKKQIIMQKLLRQKAKYLVFLVSLLLLH